MTATSLYTLLTSFAFSPSSLPFTSGLPPIQKARSFHWNAYSISRQAICVIIQRDFTHPSTLDSCVLCIPAGASASGERRAFCFHIWAAALSRILFGSSKYGWGTGLVGGLSIYRTGVLREIFCIWNGFARERSCLHDDEMVCVFMDWDCFLWCMVRWSRVGV